MRPKYTEAQRLARFIHRVEHGKRCAQCNALTPYAGFNRDARRIDQCAATCNVCKRVKRRLNRAGLGAQWPNVRLALRLASNPPIPANTSPGVRM